MAAALAAGLLGWAVLTLLERRTKRARALWIVGATALYLASLFPAVAPGATPADVRIGLVLLHTVVAVVVAGGLLLARRGD